MPAGNPTLPTLADGSALSNQLDTRVGIRHMLFGVDENDVPSHFTRFIEQQLRIFDLLVAARQGFVVWLGGLNVGVYELKAYAIAGVLKSYPGDTSVALAPNVTTRLYLDADQTLKTTTGAWPADVFRLAEVVTGAAAVSSIIDHRWFNVPIAGSNSWYNVAAQANVNCNNKELNDIKSIDFTDSTALTITAGVITPTQMLHTIQGSGGVGTVITITPVAGKRRWLLLGADANDQITIEHLSDNIYLADGKNILLRNEGPEAEATVILLYQYNDTHWREICRSTQGIAKLLEDVDADGFDITDVGRIKFNPGPSQQLATGILNFATWHQNLIRVDSQGGVGNDDMIGISNGAEGDFVILFTTDTDRIITLKSEQPGGNLLLLNSWDYVMDSTFKCIMLFRLPGSDLWLELFRSHMLSHFLTETGKNVHSLITSPVFTGPLAAAVLPWRVRIEVDTVVSRFAAMVPDGDEPTGGPCTVKLLDDGVAVGTAAIADGQELAVSSTINYVFAAGSILSLEVDGAGGSPHGADKLTCTIYAYNDLKAEPGL